MPPAEDRNDRERLKAIEMAVGQIEKQFGKGSIMRLGQKDAVNAVPAISTGSVSLDYALGIGGVPRGRVVEIFGPESSGKTTLSLQVIAEAQKLGGMAAFVDAEPLGILRVERVLRVHEGRHAAELLRLGDHLQREGRLAGGFRAEDLNDASAGEAASAERRIKRDRDKRRIKCGLR